MWCCKGVEVGRGDVIEELSVIQYPACGVDLCNVELS